MGDGFTGQKTQPLTNSIKVLKEHKEYTNNTNTISVCVQIYKNTANPLVYTNMG